MCKHYLLDKKIAPKINIIIYIIKLKILYCNYIINIVIKNYSNKYIFKIIKQK